MVAGIYQGTGQRSAVQEWRRYWPLVLSGWSGALIIPVASVTLGVMMAPIEQETGWTRTEITSGPVLISITGIFFSTLIGMAIDRLGFRLIGIAVVSLIVASTGFMSTVDNLWIWLVLWGFYGLAATANPAVFNVPIVSTFNASRGLALIVRGSGMAITSAVAPVMAVFLIEHYGWRLSYVALALIWGGFALPIMYFFFKMPKGERVVSRDDAGSTEKAAPAPDVPLPGVTMREGFKSPVFYKLMLAGMCASMVGTTMSLNMVPILTLDGLSRTAAAVAAGTMGISTLVGKVMGAFFIDRINPKLLCAAASLGSLAMPAFFLAFPGDLTAAVAGIAIYGFLQGFDGPAGTLLFSRHLGARAFGALTSTDKAISGFIIGIAPMFASYLYDTTHSYDLVLWCAFPALIISTLLYLSLGRYPDQLPNQQAVTVQAS